MEMFHFVKYGSFPTPVKYNGVSNAIEDIPGVTSSVLPKSLHFDILWPKQKQKASFRVVSGKNETLWCL